jgi:protein-tyrosine phosphatase
MGMLNPVGRFVRKLLSQHKISFVSTDAHRDTGSRVPDILECAKFIQKKYGEDYARLILYGNAMNLLR